MGSLILKGRADRIPRRRDPAYAAPQRPSTPPGAPRATCAPARRSTMTGGDVRRRGGAPMTRTLSPAAALAGRICRPQRVGLFGHRGAGKTTLLTMLYREAVGGRLPGLRLAAADARTADYLADKIAQLEAG